MELSKILHKRGALCLLASYIGASGSYTALAQCLPGLGATPGELSSQVWPRNFQPAGIKGFTTTTYSAGQTNVTTTPFQNVTSVTNNGQGYVYVLDAGAKKIYVFTGISGSNPVLGETIELASSASPNGPPYNTPATAIFFAGGTLWAALSDHTVAYLEVNGFAVPHTQGYPVISAYNYDLTGATFDGQFVYFTTKQGFVVQVKPPVHTTSGGSSNFTAPVITNKVLVEYAGLTPPIFDGNSVWTTMGSALVSIDPQTLRQAAYAPGGVLSNVAFDGAFLWMLNQSGGDIVVFDPIKQRVVSTLPVAALAGSSFASLVFSPGTVTLFNSSEAARLRTCDAYGRGSATGDFLGGTFDGAHTWLVHGAGMFVW